MVESLLAFHDFVTSNPAYGAYVVMASTMVRWNEEIMSEKISLFNAKDASGKSLEKRDKEIERVHEYTDGLLKMVKDMDALSKMLTDEELVTAKDKVANGKEARIPL